MVEIANKPDQNGTSKLVDDFRSIACLEIGKLIKGHGIYLGYYPIRDDQGNVLSDENGNDVQHHFFANTQDLKNTSDQKLSLDFYDAQVEIGRIKNGEYFHHNQHFTRQLSEGNYRGGWRAPSKDIVAIMHEHQDTGDFKNTFVQAAYGSSSRYGGDSHLSKHVYRHAFNVSNGYVHHISEDMPSLWRPVRSIPTLEAVQESYRLA